MTPRYTCKIQECVIVKRENGRVTLRYPDLEGNGDFEISDLEFQALYEPVPAVQKHVAPKPTVGRIVHYQSYGTPAREYLPEARAAVITAVHENGTVDVCVLNPTGVFFNQHVRFADAPTPGCVNWPPRT